MNMTCSNITHSNVNGNLLQFDKFILKSTKYAQIATLMSCILLFLMYDQIKYSTPANTALKLSLTSVAMQSVFDAYLSLIHLIIALYNSELFYPFFIVFLLQFVAFSMFNLRLTLLVWRGRRPLDFSSG